MSQLTLYYSEIRASARQIRSAASEYSDAKSATQKVCTKIGNLTLGSSTYTSYVDTFATVKIRDIDEIYNQMIAGANDIDYLVNEIVEQDEEVATTLQRVTDEFTKTEGIEIAWYTRVFAWISEKLEGSDWGKIVNSVIRNVSNAISNAWDDFLYWYTFEGGQYIIGTLFAALAVAALAALAISAILAAIGAIIILGSAIAAGAVTAGIVWSAVTATASAVLAIIKVADKTVDFCGELKAYSVYDVDPGWANRYSETDKTADWLEKTNFGDGTLNQWSYTASSAIEWTTLACELINLADTAATVGKNVKNLYESLGDIKKASLDQDGNVDRLEYIKEFKKTWSEIGKASKEKATSIDIRNIRATGESKTDATDFVDFIKNVVPKINKVASFGHTIDDLATKDWSEIALDKLKDKLKKITYYDKIETVIKAYPS